MPARIARHSPPPRPAGPADSVPAEGQTLDGLLTAWGVQELLRKSSGMTGAQFADFWQQFLADHDGKRNKAGRLHLGTRARALHHGFRELNGLLDRRASRGLSALMRVIAEMPGPGVSRAMDDIAVALSQYDSDLLRTVADEVWCSYREREIRHRPTADQCRWMVQAANAALDELTALVRSRGRRATTAPTPERSGRSPPPTAPSPRAGFRRGN
jgi:hypothetical protein